MNKKIKVDNPNQLPTIKYSELEDLQMDFKTIGREELNKLKNSIIKHGIFLPKFVWENKNIYWTLDGHQTKKALIELESEYEIPKIPIIMIKAKSKKDAIEKILIINSRYGKINKKTELFEYYDFKFEDLIDEIEIPELQLESILQEDTEQDDVIPDEVDAITQSGDLWELGRHRVLCGNSFDKDDLDKLMINKIDMVFTDPPYGMGLNTDFSSMIRIGKGKKYDAIINDDREYNPTFILEYFNY